MTYSWFNIIFVLINASDVDIMVGSQLLVICYLFHTVSGRSLTWFKHFSALTWHHRSVSCSFTVSDLRLKESLQVGDRLYIRAVLNHEL